MATQALKYHSISPEVLDVLRAATIDGNFVRLNGQLDRKTYADTDKVLQNLGGKWNRGKKAHVFSEDPQQVLDGVLDSGKTALLSKNGFFPTPRNLADEVVALAAIKPGQKVLEPSAGDGALACAIMRAHPTTNLIMVENNPKLVEKLRELVATNFGFEYFGGCAGFYEADFMALSLEPEYDAVVMNPPFENSADMKHVLQAWDLLKPGGRLVAIMGAGCTFRSDKISTAFREFIEMNGQIRQLPERSFHESGTDVNTILFTAVKPFNC